MSIAAQKSRPVTLEEAILDQIGRFGPKRASFGDLVRMTSALFSEECSASAVARTLDKLIEQERVVIRLHLAGEEGTYERVY